MSAVPASEPSPRALSAAEWCDRVATGSLSAEEAQAFEAWMEADPENRAAFDRATFIWRALDGRAAAPELTRVRVDALSALEEATDPRPARWRPWAWGGAIAACLALVLVMGSYFLVPVRAERFETGIGERRLVVLADGSKLSLDAASQVDVRYSPDKRVLELTSGRAKFDVAKDPLRPFSVAAGDKLIVATGTSFSVEMVGGKVEVVLYEGHVAVLSRDGKRLLASPERAGTGVLAKGAPPPSAIPAENALKPGMELTLPSAGVGTVEAIDPARSLSWEGGQLSFTGEPLASAVERMNRYGGTPIEVRGAGAAAMPIDGVFNAGDTDSFVAGITGVFPVKSRRVDGKIVLESR